MSWWEIKDERAGVTLALVNASSLNRAEARRIGDRISMVLGGVPLAMHLKTARPNPTLVHHGIAHSARWHLVTAADHAPVADLYAVIQPAEASRIAHAIADMTRVPMLLVSNRGEPQGGISRHPLVRDASGSLEHRPAPRLNPKRGGRKNPDSVTLAKERDLTVRLLEQLRFDALADDVRTGRHTAREALRYLLAPSNRLLPESRKMIVRAALGVLEAGQGMTAKELAGLKVRARAAAKRGNPRRDYKVPPLIVGKIAGLLAAAGYRSHADDLRADPDFRVATGTIADAAARRNGPEDAKLLSEARWLLNQAWSDAGGGHLIPRAAKRPRANPGGRNPRGGPRIVYNRLLGGWYVVVGPHQTPLNGRFNSKEEAQAWLGRRSNPSRSKGARASKKRHRIALEWMPRRLRRASTTALRRPASPGNAAQSLYYLEHHRARAVRRAGPSPPRIPMGRRPNPGGRKIQVGDRVRYSAAWLRSTGTYTGDLPQAKGIVTGLTPFGGPGNALATIEWDRPGIPGKVLTPNLVKVGQLKPNPRGAEFSAMQPPPASRRLDALLERAQALWDAGRKEEAQTLYDKAWAMVQPIGNPGGRYKVQANADWVGPQGRATVYEVIDTRDGSVAWRGYKAGDATIQRAYLNKFGPEKSKRAPDHPSRNPTYRLTATLKTVRGRRGRPPGLAVVPAARVRAPRGPRVPRARARFQAGERVSVPYTGRESYFGRAVNKTREHATAQGYASEGGAEMVVVHVRRGQGTETHTFPPSAVRRLPRRGASAERARLSLDQIRAEMAQVDTAAHELYPQGGEPPTPEYRAARRRLTKLENELRAREIVASEQAATGTDDPWRNPRGRLRRPRGRLTANPRSEMSRALATARMWSELEPGRVTRVKGPKRVPRVMAKLGELVSVVYRSDKYDGKSKLYEHKTRRPRPVLATDPDGRDVFVVGGDMKVTADGLVN